MKTLDDVKKIIEELKELYDDVQLFQVEDTKKIYEGQKCAMRVCSAARRGSRFCRQCIVKQALEEEKDKTKVEFFKTDIVLMNDKPSAIATAISISRKTHRIVNENIAFALIVGGFNLGFFPMHLLGLMGMPRRVDTYLPGRLWEVPNLVSTVGAFVMTAGALLFVIDAVRCFTRSSRARLPLAMRKRFSARAMGRSRRAPRAEAARIDRLAAGLPSRAWLPADDTWIGTPG